MRHPLEQVRWLAAAHIAPNSWNPNRVHKPELRLLERSLLATGWVQPLLVVPDAAEPDRYRIVDGFHRWRLAQDSARIQARDAGLVPCCVLDLTVAEAMLLTVRINRAKGTHASVLMSELVRALVHEHGVDPQQVMDEMGATRDEVDLLLADGVLKARNIAGWAYSPAWYGVQSKTRPSDEPVEDCAGRPPVHYRS